jgi:hypothetical protein
VVHSLVQKWLGESYEWWFAPETAAQYDVDGARVQGHCDGVLLNRNNRQRAYVIEIKTIEYEAFKLLTKPKSEHIRQALLYCAAQKLLGVIVLYWDKNRCYLKEYYVSIKSKLARKVMKENRQRIRSLKVYVDRFEESRDPDDLPAYVKADCNKAFCNYVKYCKRNGAPV